MLQHFRVDPVRLVPYLCLIAAGCAANASAAAPISLPPLDFSQAMAWTAETAPEGHRLIRFRWLFNDGQASVGGQGSVRLAGPDSMRFDIAGPWGIGGAAAVVIGDRPQWVKPPDIIAKLIPSYPLMWAMFGAVSPPPAGSRITGMRDGSGMNLDWSLGADTVQYQPLLGHQPTGLLAEWRRAGVTMGRVETRLDAHGAPVSSRLTVPSVPARLDITIVADSITGAFPASVWTPPAP